MDIKDLLALVNAGYTKEEIVQMTATPAPTSEPAPVPTPVPEVKPVEEPAPAPVAVDEPTPQPQPQPQPVQAPAQEQPTMAQIMESVAKLTSAVQANAIAQSVIPQGLSNPPSAEDMLAEIIRPTFKDRN